MYEIWIVLVLAVASARPRLISEYPPIESFYYHPRPLAPIAFPIRPWPQISKSYQDFGQALLRLKSRIKEPIDSLPPDTVDHSLEYKPMRPFHAGSGTLGQVVPPEDYGTNKPPTLVDRIQESPGSSGSTSAVPSKEQSSISLEYKPNRPSFHPNPGSTLGQIIPPGKPWPVSAQGYQNSSQLSAINIVDRIKGTTGDKSSNKVEATTSIGFEWNSDPEDEQNKDTPTKEQTSISLEYKPNRPFHHQSPGSHLGQIVPPGEPWPDSSQGYQNFSQLSSTNITDRIKETVSENKTSTPSTGFIWTSDLEDEQIKNISTTLINRTEDFVDFIPSTTTPISIGNKPNRPSFHPNPGSTLGQVVPPGEPWPDSASGYQNFSQISSTIANRIQEIAAEIKPTTVSSFTWPFDLEETSTKQPSPSILVDRMKDSPSLSTEKTSSSFPGQTPISLEYKPNRPFFHPKPGSTLGQVVPPGEPWPASAAGYQNFSQVAPSPNLGIRIKDSTSLSTTPRTKESSQTTPINLEYKPTRPPFHPNPGDTVTQIIPPGQPWPSSPEDYQNFTQNRIKETKGTPSTKRIATTTVISLAYKPTRPFYHSNPGNTLSPMVPPGKPWPSSAGGYQSFSQLPNRLKEFATETKPWPNKLETTFETTQAGSTWETETSSETGRSEATESTTAEETSTVGKDTNEVTEKGRLYTSASLQT